MKIISEQQAQELFKDQCPNSQFVWLTDKHYILPSFEEVEVFVKSSDISKRVFIERIQECDEFALLLHAKAKGDRGRLAQEGKIPSDQWYSWLFGEAFAIMAAGRRALHNLNICMCEDEKARMIEPQTNNIWELDPRRDVVLLIKA